MSISSCLLHFSSSSAVYFFPMVPASSSAYDTIKIRKMRMRTRFLSVIMPMDSMPLLCHLYGHKDEGAKESNLRWKSSFRKRWQVQRDEKPGRKPPYRKTRSDRNISLFCTKAINRSLQDGLL